MIDRDRLRRLALHARDDDRDEAAALRLSPAQLELALALDPSTVLVLVEEADARRSFEMALEALVASAKEQDARLEKMVVRWESELKKLRRRPLVEMAAAIEAVERCVAEVRECVKGER